MIDKYQFVSLANHMLLGAVNAVRADMNDGAAFDEPAYTASIVTKFPALMNGNWGGAKFGGCFIHKRPKVKIEGKNEGCEAGDLLVLSKKAFGKNTQYKATLFQLKRSNGFYDSVVPDNPRQLELYTKWPLFKFAYRYGLEESVQYDIQPKYAMPGAKYMFINDAPYEYIFYGDLDYIWYSNMPIVYTYSIPAGEMENLPELSFGMFLWRFMQGKDSYRISESRATAKNDWDRFIWDLIEMTKNSAFKHKAISPQAMSRTNGDFFGFMKKKDSESHFSALYTDWLAINKPKGNKLEVNTLDGDKHIENNNRNLEEESGGISILFIDLDGDNFEKKKEEE